MKNVVFRDNVAVQNIAFFSEGCVNLFCIHLQPLRNVFNAEYSKFQFFIALDNLSDFSDNN